MPDQRLELSTLSAHQNLAFLNMLNLVVSRCAFHEVNGVLKSNSFYPPNVLEIYLC